MTLKLTYAQVNLAHAQTYDALHLGQNKILLVTKYINNQYLELLKTNGSARW